MELKELDGAYDVVISDERFNTFSPLVPLSLDCLSFLGLSELPNDFVACTLPACISDFFVSYYDTIKQEDSFTFTPEDIKESKYSDVFRVYLRIAEKYLFDYCMLKGLDFRNYRVTEDIQFIPKFSHFSYDYHQSMYHMYICIFLDPVIDAHSFTYNAFNKLEMLLGNAVPHILPHTAGFYLNSEKEIPAMILKVKGV